MHLKFRVLIILSFLAIFTIPVQGQSNTNFDSLICKEWKLAYYNENGHRFPPSPEQINDKTIFYFNHKVKSIEASKVEDGIWQYDPKSKTLSVKDNLTKVNTILKVLKLTEEVCILEFKDPDGSVIEIEMVSSR